MSFTSNSAVQQALVIETSKAPFTLKSIPVPKPGPGELLVKVFAAAMNPVDHFIQAFDLFPNFKYPAVIGFDVAGEVEEVGEDVEGFAKGDKVFFEGQENKSEYDAFQQYALTTADTTAKIPAGLSYAQASTIPLTLMTAVIGLLPAHPIGAGLNPTLDPQVSFAGETALVIGGGTCVGQFAIQTLRYLKFTTIITYASAKHTSYLKSLGATHIVDRTHVPLSDLPSAVAHLTSESIKVVYSAVTAPEAQEAGYACLGRNCAAKIAIAHPRPEVPKRKENGEVIEDPEGRIVYSCYGSPHTEANREFGRLFWGKLAGMVEEGVFVPSRVESLPNGLLGVVEGAKMLGNGEVSGVKLVVYPQETA